VAVATRGDEIERLVRAALVTRDDVIERDVPRLLVTQVFQAVLTREPVANVDRESRDGPDPLAAILVGAHVIPQLFPSSTSTRTGTCITEPFQLFVSAAS